MKYSIIGFLILLSQTTFAQSHTYECQSKDMISGQRLLGVAQRVIVDEEKFTATFEQKNYSPQAVWKEVAVMKADPFNTLPDRFTSDGTNIVFYRGTEIFIQDEQVDEKVDGDGVLTIFLQDKSSRSWLCKLKN